MLEPFRPLRSRLCIAMFCGLSLANASAGTLLLTGQVDGQYDYSLELDPNQGLVISLGDEIVLSGLSEVTGASVVPALNFAYSTLLVSQET